MSTESKDSVLAGLYQLRAGMSFLADKQDVMRGYRRAMTI